MKQFFVEVTKETSLLVQLALFNKGYGWFLGEKTIQSFVHPYLIVRDDNIILHSDIRAIHCPVLNLEQFTEWYQTGKLPQVVYEYKITNYNVANITKESVKIGSWVIPKDVAVGFANKILEVMNG